MFILASETIEKTTWYPLTLGWLVVIAGIGMFFGSTYLLLATNVGSRLGFLVVGSVGTGFIVLLSLLWMTTATPLNVFKGRQPEWTPIEIVNSVSSSKIPEVQSIRENGQKLSSTDFANIKSAADTILTPAPEGTDAHQPESIANKLPTVQVLVTEIYSVGGSRPNPLHFEFSHVPNYAAISYCQLDQEKAQTAFRSACDTSKEAAANSKVLIVQSDLGSIRQPPTFLFLGSATLFIIFLLSLYWRDSDLREVKVQDDGETEPSDDKDQDVDDDEKVNA